MKAKVRKPLQQRYSLFVVSFQIACIALIAGCSGGDSLGRVSGTVTLDGEPMAGVEVVFSPLPVEGNSIVGPWSTGVTDAEGKYEMKTRHGKTGAWVGTHDVIFEYPGGGLEEAAELKADLKEAESKEEAAEINAALAELKKKLKGRPRIPKSASRQISIPSGGIQPCDFELVSDQ